MNYLIPCIFPKTDTEPPPHSRWLSMCRFAADTSDNFARLIEWRQKAQRLYFCESPSPFEAKSKSSDEELESSAAKRGKPRRVRYSKPNPVDFAAAFGCAVTAHSASKTDWIAKKGRGCLYHALRRVSPEVCSQHQCRAILRTWVDPHELTSQR